MTFKTERGWSAWNNLNAKKSSSAWCVGVTHFWLISLSLFRSKYIEHRQPGVYRELLFKNLLNQSLHIVICRESRITVITQNNKIQFRVCATFVTHKVTTAQLILKMDPSNPLTKVYNKHNLVPTIEHLHAKELTWWTWMKPI